MERQAGPFRLGQGEEAAAVDHRVGALPRAGHVHRLLIRAVPLHPRREHVCVTGVERVRRVGPSVEHREEPVELKSERHRVTERQVDRVWSSTILFAVVAQCGRRQRREEREQRHTCGKSHPDQTRPCLCCSHGSDGETPAHREPWVHGAHAPCCTARRISPCGKGRGLPDGEVRLATRQRACTSSAHGLPGVRARTMRTCEEGSDRGCITWPRRGAGRRS